MTDLDPRHWLDVEEKIAALEAGHPIPRQAEWLFWVRICVKRSAPIITAEHIARLTAAGFDLTPDGDDQQVPLPEAPEPPVALSQPGTLRRFEPSGNGTGTFVGNRFMEINARWSTMRSTTLHERLRGDPGQWQEYHEEYARQRTRWPVVPAEEIADALHRLWPRASRRVADLGCGRDMLLAGRLRDLGSTHEVTGFDHVDSGPDTIAADFSELDSGWDEGFDVAVLCLALVGTNRWDYFARARDLITVDGSLIVAETQDRHAPEGGTSIPERLTDLGMEVRSETTLDGGFILTRAVRRK